MTTMKVSVTDLPVIRTTITFVIDFIDEYAWHKPDCLSIPTDGRRNCDCGYDEALETLNTLRVRPVNA